MLWLVWTFIEHCSFKHGSSKSSFCWIECPWDFCLFKTQLSVTILHWIFFHVVMCQLNMLLLLFFPSHTASHPLQTHLCSTKRPTYHPSIIFSQTIFYLCCISYLHLFSCLHPTIYLIFVMCHPSPRLFMSPSTTGRRTTHLTVCPSHPSVLTTVWRSRR